MDQWRLGKRPALDGLRGVAVLLVVVFHVSSGSAFISGGIVGVTAFFVLSGFLITALLLQERDAGGIGFAGFYKRRAYRLFPALALMLAVIGPYALATDNISLGSFAAVVFYSANWAAVNGQSLGMLSHTWSLATEEQFYLIWPTALLLLCRVPRGVLLALGAGLVLAMTGALGAMVGVVAMLAGAALAAHLHDRPAPTPVSPVVVPGLLVALLGLGMLELDPTVTVLAVTAVTTGLLYAIATGATAHGLAGTWLRVVGQRSYGLYLWHLPLLVIGTDIGREFGLAFWPSVFLTLPVIALVVEMSWRFVEVPMLRRKSRRQTSAACAEIWAPESAVP